MYTIRCLTLLASAAIMTGCSVTFGSSSPASPAVTIPPGFSAGVYPRVAVFTENLTRTRLSDGVMRVIEDAFFRSALERGYAVAARTDLERVLQEQQLQRSALTEAALARAGRALNVPGVIIVTVNTIQVEQYASDNRGGRYYRATVGMSARLLDVELVQVRWLAEYTGRANIATRNEPERAVSYVASVLATALPSLLPASRVP